MESDTMRNNTNNRSSSRRGGNARNARSGEHRFGGNNDRGFRTGSFNRPPREMHKATCSECKKECEVPFKPTEGKSVYCKECFEKHKPKRF